MSVNDPANRTPDTKNATWGSGMARTLAQGKNEPQVAR